MHLGMPLGVWKHGSNPILEWRVPLPSADELDDLAFADTDETDVPVLLHVDEAEWRAL